jgi:tetratricopeptide (TPR) repeat protein
MLQHPRIPALIALAVTLAIGMVAYCIFSADDTAARGAGATLEQLELVIASGQADAATWFHYGERLREAGRFSHAAQAYKKVLELEHYHAEARFNCALALAQSGNGEEFYFFMEDVTRDYPKRAVDIFDRPEVARYLSEPRFQEMRREAQNLAMD